MSVLLVCGFVIIGMFAFFFVIGFITNQNRKRKMKSFKVGDVCQIRNIDGKTIYAKLSAWNSSHLFFQYEGGVFEQDWSDLKLNKSLKWRENYEDSVKAMNGQKPTFDPIVSIKHESSTSDQIDPTFNKPLENLNETEANIALKHAIEQEKFEYAEKIRQHLTKFR
jgi:hypothetical protein